MTTSTIFLVPGKGRRVGALLWTCHSRGVGGIAIEGGLESLNAAVPYIHIICILKYIHNQYTHTHTDPLLFVL